MDSSSQASLQEPFGQLVQMLVQHAALALGKLPHPATGEARPNAPVARLMLDHLAVLEEKTKGNLDEGEQAILSQARERLEGFYEELDEDQ